MLKADTQRWLSLIRDGERNALARAITLVESTRPDDQRLARALVSNLTHARTSIRVAISGAPGVGKSSFIEKLGLYLIDQGRKLAVLTIDPSSHFSSGSILGDRTRMEELSKSPEAFIRQSPSSNFVGGVSRRTRENIFLCEEAGFDVIIVETVGIGQSEYLAERLTDIFALLIQPGSGDDLQGVKRGIMEMADLYVVTKADGPLAAAANEARQFLHMSIKMLSAKNEGLQRKILLTSSKENKGIDRFWSEIENLHHQLSEHGHLEHRRRDQKLDWLKDLIQEQWLNQLNGNETFKKRWDMLTPKVRDGKLDVYHVLEELVKDL